jgi:hypothetical protein
MVQGMMKFIGPAKNAPFVITRTMDPERKFIVETKVRKTEVINEAEGTGMFGWTTNNMLTPYRRTQKFS